MLPSQILSEEHKNILFMLDVLKEKAIGLQGESPASTAELSKLVDFLRHYADTYHHGKEEDILFPKYAEAGVPKDPGPIGVMLQEHVLGRNHIKTMLEAIDEMNSGTENKASKVKFIQHAQGYYELLRNHIHKEDNILYPMGDSHLSDNDQSSVSEKFEAFEANKFHHVPQLKEVLQTLEAYRS